MTTFEIEYPGKAVCVFNLDDRFFRESNGCLITMDWF